MDKYQILGEGPIGKATTVIAGAAATSPLWLDKVSEWASSFLPILGCLWLVLQIVVFINKNFNRDKKNDD